MNYSIIDKITKSSKRKSLYHFTRLSNLHSIAYFDALFSCHKVDPSLSSQRREATMQAKFDGQIFTANPHLRIVDRMMAPGTTQQEFRAYLDQHVFLFPNKRNCLYMMRTYRRREPNESFIILEFDAASLLYDYYYKVKLSKYDSGSSPRFPNRCSYRKGIEMFLPINQFESVKNNLVPTTASEIYEVLVEDEIRNLSKYLRVLYCSNTAEILEKWRQLKEDLTEIDGLND
jgi:hypothetical protein